MAFSILAEGLLRIEHKVDALLRHLKTPTTPLHFAGSICPVCLKNIDYQIDLQYGVAIRRCGCKTGKIPSMIPLLPEAPKKEDPNARNSVVESEDRPELRAKNSGGGKAR